MSDTPDRPLDDDLPPVRVLISYRREDSAGHAGRLYDSLIEHFGREQVFIDIAAIEPGVDFSEVIAREVGSCDVLLAVIGKNWLNITDTKGRRRLDNPDDFHRLEIQAALERNIRVVPLLVQNAAMPSLEDLPEAIARLALRNALELSDERWQYDVGRLVSAVENVARSKGLRPRASEEAEPPPDTSTPPLPVSTDTPPMPVAPDVPPPPMPPARPDFESTIPVPPAAATLPIGPPMPPDRPPMAGDPFGPGGGGPPKPNRKPLIFALIGLVLVVAIVGGIIVFAGGKDDKPQAGPSRTPTSTTSPSPSSSSPPADLDDEQTELAGRVPTDFVDSCIADEGFMPDKAIAGIKCEKDANEIWYYLFDTGADVDAWYITQRDAWNLDPETGDCETDDRGEDPMYVDDELVGRLLCYNDDTGRWLEWKRADYRVYTYARRTDRLKQELFDFWKNAGPRKV
jgi:TIR domain-containing protein